MKLFVLISSLVLSSAAFATNLCDGSNPSFWTCKAKNPGGETIAMSISPEAKASTVFKAAPSLILTEF